MGAFGVRGVRLGFPPTARAGGGSAAKAAATASMLGWQPACTQILESSPRLAMLSPRRIGSGQIAHRPEYLACTALPLGDLVRLDRHPQVPMLAAPTPDMPDPRLTRQKASQRAATAPRRAVDRRQALKCHTPGHLDCSIAECRRQVSGLIRRWSPPGQAASTCLQREPAP